jgi:hypothetical protein
MEGSMKTMSWSRYHCLSWSFIRARQHRAATGRRIRRRNDMRHGAQAVPRLMPVAFGRLQDMGFQLVLRMFRTEARSANTDV